MNNKKGSIVFIVLMFIITLTTILYSSLRTNAYFISIAREREKYEVQYQLVYALQRFIATHYMDQIKNNQEIEQKTILFKAPWPDTNSGYQGYVWITRKKLSSGTITTSLNTTIRHKKKTVIDLKTEYKGV